MGARRRARERVLQALYAFHVGRGKTRLDSRIVPAVLSELRSRFPIQTDQMDIEQGVADTSTEDVEYATRLLKGVVERLEELDRRVASASSSWRPDRMDAVDLCIIRAAVFELIHVDDLPAAVAINEAVELARKYGNEQSPAFVNGVLDRIRCDLVGDGSSLHEH